MTILQSLIANYLQMVEQICGSCNLISFSSFVGQKTSSPTIMCCAVIVGGFWLGVDQENVAGNDLGTPVHVLLVSHSMISAIKWGIHNMLNTLGVWGQPQYSMSKKKKCLSENTWYRWLAETVTHFTCTKELHDTYLGLDSGYPHRFLVVFPSLCRHMPGQCLKLCHKHLPYKLPYRSKLTGGRIIKLFIIY